jgi:hypothetical protein
LKKSELPTDPESLVLPLHYSLVRCNELYLIRLRTLEIGVKGVGVVVDGSLAAALESI